MIRKGLTEWAGPRINFNYPINAYPSCSYSYSVGEATPTTVTYSIGLGTSVSVNFNGDSHTTSPSTTVTMANENGNTLSFGTTNINAPLMNGSGNAADTNVIFNNGVKSAGGVAIADQATITLTKDSTRPQSVWYTVSASGQTTDGGQQAITQAGYELTQVEKDNIFAVSIGKSLWRHKVERWSNRIR